MAISFLKQFFPILLLISVFCGGMPAAHADLMIAPLRVEMADRNRSADVHLINTSNKTNTYRVTWRHMKMDENGVYSRSEQSLTPFDLAAAARVAPRQITLKPGERQVVRLSIRRPADLPPGEYRSHLVLQNIGSVDNAPSDQNDVSGIKMAVTVNVGHAIPVIYRVGSRDVKVKITDTSFAKDERSPYLGVTFKREGLHGAAGRLAVERLDYPKEPPIQPMDYINIFTEVTERHLKFRLPEGLRPGERLRLYFTDSGRESGDRVLAEKIVAVP